MGNDGILPGTYPTWVPKAVHDYLVHTRDGLSMRELARAAGCQPSTVSRRVRSIESRRDDPLVDSALNRLGRLTHVPKGKPRNEEESRDMEMFAELELPSEQKLNAEAQGILRRLAEQGACLALAPAMETAVVVREIEGEPAVRTATVGREIAEAMALKGWIEGSGKGRVLRYRITSAGRVALRDMTASIESQKARIHGGFDGEGDLVAGQTPDAELRPRAGRYSMSETPILTLARRRDKSGKPFLSGELVAAGERLREDFELASMRSMPMTDWLRQLGENGWDLSAIDLPDGGSAEARERLLLALKAMGAGLGDVALRCCCYLEGLETTERSMGWSARSGKIVLRIALQRLKQHYDSNSRHWSPLIG